MKSLETINCNKWLNLPSHLKQSSLTMIGNYLESWSELRFRMWFYDLDDDDDYNYLVVKS